MSEFTIRAARLADEAAVTELLGVSYPTLMATAYEPSVLAPALRHITRAKRALLDSGTFYVVEIEQDRIVGCGGWTREHPATGEIATGVAHLRHFGTHPDWIGRGVGRRIFEHCAQEARAASIDVFECFSSRNAEPFYAALGFTSLGPLVVSMPGGITFPGVLMRRSL